MKNENNPLHELEKLSQYLHGANNATNDENASATFHLVYAGSNPAIVRFITKVFC